MANKIDLEGIIARLDRGQIIPVSAADWSGLSPHFSTREIIPTGMGGEILLVRRPLPGGGQVKGWALVEEPKTEERVIRPLKSEKEARALIADRLAAYERMWDG